jgi:hypothetical protein
MKDSPRTDFHHQEYIDALKARGDCDQKVASEQSFGMVADKGIPVL